MIHVHLVRGVAERVVADHPGDLDEPGRGEVAQVLGGDRRVVLHGIGARATLDAVDLEWDRDVLALGMAGIGLQVVPLGIGQDHRARDAPAGEDHFVVAGDQGAHGVELQLVDALVMQVGEVGIGIGRRRILDRRGEDDRRQGDLLAVLGEVPVGAVEQLHRLAAEHGRGIERAAHVDPDHQRGALRVEPGAGSLVKTCGPAAVASPASATPSCRVKAPVLPGMPLPARSGSKSALPSPLTAT